MTPSSKGHIEKHALHAVSDLIADAGHAPEEISSDYGKDLLVQTNHKGQMDASRLWVQVKGTAEIERHRLKGGGFSLSIPFDHAMRWIRTLDLVVVVLWDVVEDVGWYAIPSNQVDPIEGVNSGQKTVTLRFAEDDILTKEAVDSLVRRSRLEHHRLLVLSARDMQSVEERKGSDHSHKRAITALDFTDFVCITERRSEPDGLKYRVRTEIWDEFEEILDTLPEVREGDLEKNMDKAAHKIAFRRLKMIEPEHDLPSALIEEGAQVILNALEEASEDPEALRAAEAWARENPR